VKLIGKKRGGMLTNEENMLKLYVSPAGNDAWEGTKTKPFASLERGLQATRQIKGNVRKCLMVGAGRYYEVNLALAAQDSGLTISARPGAKVCLYGGRRITGWQTDGAKFWSAAIPKVKDGQWDFRALVVNGRLARRARYPREGQLAHLSEFNVRWLSTTAGGWERPPTQEELTIMKYDPKDLGDWFEPRNAEITVYHSWDESLVGVAAMANGKIIFSTPAGHPPGAFGIKKYVVWNIKEGMSEPGQWFLDRADGRVVYWPLASENISAIEAIAPTTETIIRCEGTAQTPVKDVAIRGIGFAVANTPLVAGGFGAGKFPGALSFVSAEHCRIENCSFFGMAGQGIKVTASDDVAIQNCSLREVGAGGIVVADSRNSMLGHNHIKDVGKIYPSGIGISINGQNNSIQANQIENTPYTALVVSGDGHLVENNIIRNFMQELNDGAAIYITFCKKVVVRHNRVMGRLDSGQFKRHAYYIDEQGENCLIEQNSAFNSPSPAHTHLAKNCIMRNNVFFTAGEMKLGFFKSSGFILEKNIIYAKDAIVIQDSEPTALKAVPDNIIFSETGVIKKEGYDICDVRPPLQAVFTPQDGTVITDPLFRCPDLGDFTLKPGSPVFKLGFVPIDLSKVGPQPARSRNESEQ